MPLTPFERSRLEFPGLPLDVLLYFNLSNTPREDHAMKPRTVQAFVSATRTEYPGGAVPPTVVVEVCRRLMRWGWLSELGGGGLQGLNNAYMGIIDDPQAARSDSAFGRMLTCAVYGMPAVFDLYAEAVIPLINTHDGNPQIGTGFVLAPQALVTAAHCLAPAHALAVRDASPDQLQAARFWRHATEAFDLSVIEFAEPVFADRPRIPLPPHPAQVLDEVMALGYPDVAGFAPTLAAEAANIAARLSASRGRIASAAMEIFAQSDLLLITARVRGGFSGGPVLDGLGQAIGVISRSPEASPNPGGGHSYDDLGYGVAIPAQHIAAMFGSDGQRTAIDMSRVAFETFP